MEIKAAVAYCQRNFESTPERYGSAGGEVGAHIGGVLGIIPCYITLGIGVHEAYLQNNKKKEGLVDAVGAGLLVCTTYPLFLGYTVGYATGKLIGDIESFVSSYFCTSFNRNSVSTDLMLVN